ncbi:Integrase core domain protein [Sporotomaculum syntrophicum]|uniref:Integrase core domain protein n=1 Tax=Sporotomaculum syntrophicum TaxID=182264 RepID=A0A9D2WNN4_9FIRM|nr:DDE-type integrase/transposase/recombinase [Sporotomaculum syntrophicum]KAF1084320.1 Integrase core domain protein [Sporotomaculum syntrophicum]
MLDEKEREKIAIRKFSLVAPVLNNQTENQKEYFKKLATEPIDMPHYGLRRYTVKTFEWWLYLYRRHGLEGLKPGYRSDRGKSRRITEEIALKIQEKKIAKPKLNSILLYEELVKDGVFTPDKLSPATFYRFLAQNPDLVISQDTGKEEKEMKRFSHQKINQLWQTDILYGPHLRLGRARKRTYLIAYIDDASRLITHARFSWEQNFVAIRDVFKEAVLRRGVPKMLYTDNGKVYRCGQLASICASLGCSLLHAEPFSPNQKGKVERFFRTVRMRFLSRLEPEKINSLEELNLRFWEWLEEDYQRKVHSSLQMSPLDYFMSRADEVKMFPDPALLDEYFLMRVMRKINHDATLSLESILYETDQKLANTRLEVRYEPQWLNNPARPVFLYRDGAKVGEARQVNLLENASAKRKGRGRPAKQNEPEDTPPTYTEGEVTEPIVSFSTIFDADKETDTPDEVGEV